MNRQEALKIAASLLEELAPLCEKIEIAGSIRRLRPGVNDIDLVLLPKLGQHPAIKQRVWMLQQRQPAAFGDKIMRLANYKGIPVDFYFAEEETWATLLLIRTGSKNHNIMLARRARDFGMHLNASGYGFTGRRGEHIHVTTEGQIFREMGLPYKEPEEREA
jgi:DNA polymerase (family 10)